MTKKKSGLPDDAPALKALSFTKGGDPEEHTSGVKNNLSPSETELGLRSTKESESTNYGPVESSSLIEKTIVNAKKEELKQTTIYITPGMLLDAKRYGLDHGMKLKDLYAQALYWFLNIGPELSKLEEMCAKKQLSAPELAKKAIASIKA